MSGSDLSKADSDGSSHDSKIEPRLPKLTSQSKTYKSDSYDEDDEIEEIDLTLNNFHFKSYQGSRKTSSFGGILDTGRHVEMS